MRHLQLVTQSVSRDAEECATVLLDRIRRGEIQGLAFVALMPRRRYFTGVCGECAEDPTGVRGAILALDDEMRELVHGAGFDNTTF
jgi:hypothetical protein